MTPNYFGKILLVERCRRIDIKYFTNKVKAILKEAILNSEISAEGYTVKLVTSRTGFGGTRFWFVCPVCKRRSGVLYEHPVSQKLGCRRCLGLDYRKHRFRGMIENS